MSLSKTVLITGGTTGLGYHAAINIARLHPKYLIVLASRSDSNHAADSINKTLGQSNALFLPLDLSSLASVRGFASTWAKKDFPPIQYLLLNAGLQFPGELKKSQDGFEATFAIAHIGHALLFHLLYPHLADDARLVVTSSGTHDPAQKSGLPDAVYNSAEELAHPSSATADNPGRQRYASAKLANVLWTYALHRRFAKFGRKKTAVAFDPGLMPGTGLAREAGWFLVWVWTQVLPRMLPLLRILMKSPNVHTPQESGAALAWVAVGEENKGVSGMYMEGRVERKSSADSYDEAKQEDLWNWTIQNVALGDEERKLFDLGA